MKTVLKQFKVYAPETVKAEHSLNKDGTLTITGIASTTNQDLDGEIISEKALSSLKDQAIGLNLHLDHNHDYNGGIGAITDAYVDGNALYITANVLSEHAKGILDRLKLGMNMGFSIGGIPIIKNSRSNIIDDFILLEISLTLLPANWDTFGTVESKGLIESNCLTGACHYILKQKNKKLSDKMSEKAQGKIDDATKQELVNIVNEAIINLKPLILDELKEDMSKLVQEVVATSLGEVVPKAIDEIKSEVTSEEYIEQTTKDGEEAPVEESEEEEVVDETITEGKAEDEEVVEAPTGEEVVEEEKEVPEKVPLSGIPATQDDVQYAQVANQKPVTTPTYEIDSKAIADAVIKEIWDNLKVNRANTNTESKFNKYQKSVNTKSAKNRFLDTEKRDKFGRNKKYL